MNKPADHLVFVATSDLAGLVRGKSFPSTHWDKRSQRGVGWTPTNIQITCFDIIADSPFGALGDLALVPDPSTRIRLEGDTRSNVFDLAIGDIRSLDGEPWEFCTREIARRALGALHAVSGANPLVAFEHEFEVRYAITRQGDAYGLKGFRDAQRWAEELLAALQTAGCRPENFMKEYGAGKYELTNQPAWGLRAADDALLLRILTHDVLQRHGLTPSFSPILDPDGVGNGVHVHVSLFDDNEKPLSFDASDPHGMSDLTRHFVAGVLQYLDQILALLAPSAVSYLRLTPHRWSAAFNNLGYRDREAAVRICPVSSVDQEAIARQFNIEVRAVDAAASPYLALAAILMAGAQGIHDKLVPPPPTEEDLSLLDSATLAGRGFSRLPETLEQALQRFTDSSMVRHWFGDAFVDLYTAHKRTELAHLDGLDWAEKCQRYGEVY